MPIYAYRCTDCGFEKDVMRKVIDPLLTTCPECKTESFVKQLTAPAFQLKGSGWYVTDFKGGAKSSDAESESKPEGKTESKPDAKTESKPEGKPDAKSEAKTEAKSESKSEGKTEAKTETKTEAKSDSTKRS